MRAGLVAGLGWREEELAAIERALEHRLSGLALKRAITAEIARRLEEGGAEAAVALMRAVYGDLPLRAGDVASVVTTTGIFFCLPLVEDGLDVPGYAERPEGERAAIGQFAARLGKAATSLKNVRFPAFGLFDPAAVDADFHRELTAQVASQDPSLARVPEKVVADTFATMVLVIPSGEAPKYLIHDSWGHGWQESLCEFEWLFGDFQDMSAALRGDALRAGFVDAGGRTVVDEAGLERAAGADLRRRRHRAKLSCRGAGRLMEHSTAAARDLAVVVAPPEAILKLDLSGRRQPRRGPWRRSESQMTRSAERAASCRRACASGCRATPAEAVDSAWAHQRPVAPALPPLARRGAAAGPPTLSGQRAVLGVATLEAALSQLIARGEAVWSRE